MEEVAESDLLVHVVDYSNPEYEQLIAVTNETLKELGADHIPVVYAYNKTELTGSEWPENEQDIVYVSARQKIGIDALVARIRDRIFDDYIQCELLIPFEQGRLISYFNENAHIMSTSYEENGTKLTLECKRADYEKYKDDVILL